MSTIPVILEEQKYSESDTLGILAPKSVVKALDTEKLKTSIMGLSSQITGILGDIKQVGGFRLTEVKVSVEITAEGGVALIGNAKVGSKGAISLTFKL